jgi:hypothetical protein
VNHSEHYPTFIEHPKDPQKRALVKTPWEHHRQLLAWRLDGLDPEPEAPGEVRKAQSTFDPEYPKWIEHPKTGARVLVANRQGEKDQLEAWIAKKTVKPTGTASANVGSGKTGNKGKGAGPKQPPTVDELIAKNYPPSIAQRMADEEIRKFNAGEAPYNQE